MKKIVPFILLTLGVLSILYGVAIMMIGSGTLFHAVWYALGALLIGTALAIYKELPKRLPVWLKRIGAVVFAVCLGVLLVTQILILGQFNSKGEKDLDYIVVLGAQVYADGSPSAVLKYRLDAALDYLEENPRTRCIVSGGQGPNETMPEAQGMAAYLEANGIAKERIILESQSLNTVQNISYSFALVDNPDARVGIVTNNFHVFRAVHIAKKAGYSNISGIAAYSSRWVQPNNMLREGLGIIKDALSGNI